ncbi:MAG: GyrI-like domain-containing protein [Promethearchaeota archaeon]
MNSQSELAIKHKKLETTLIASIRFNLKERKEIQALFHKLNQNIPKEVISGPGFCIYHFITSVKEGFDIEAGFPVSQDVQTSGIKTRMLPEMEVLSLVHKGSVGKIRETLRKLYSYAYEHGLISDEFSREVYLDSNNPEGNEIELQFVIHDWNRLFSKSLEQILGEETKQEVMKGNEDLTIDSSLDERHQWIKGALKRLDNLAEEEQKYKIISSCAHVFAKEPIEKIRTLYEKTKKQTNDPLKAVDAVLDFMEKDPAWAKRPIRNGNIIYSTKIPRDPQGYEKATDKAEKRKAYCFCPIIRNRLDDEEMPITFCYCGAGWFRQQWEGTLGKSVKIEIVKSVLKGNDECQFAIHLPNDL